MLAQKQPLIQRVRNSSLVEWLGAEDLTGLKFTPKLRQYLYWVGERSCGGEALPKGDVDLQEERMPE